MDAVRQWALLLAPPLLISSMWGAFRGFRALMGPKVGYFAGFVCYWLAWCLAFPLWIMKGKGFTGLFRRNSHPFGKPAWLGLLLLLFPAVGSALLGIKGRAEREAAAAYQTVPVPSVQSDGLAIYCFGQGEPLLFMPYPHAASVVGDPTPAALIEGLEQASRQVITFDPPGAGRSTRPARLDLAEMLDSAEEALARSGVDGPVDVVGHSQGAFVALAFSIERTSRVRRLILIGAGAGGLSWMRAPGALWNRSHPAFWRFGLWGLVYQLTRRLAPEKHMLNVVSRASWVEHSHAPQRYVSLLDWVRSAHHRTQWGQVARRLSYRPRLGEVRVPTLVLVGRYDPQTPPACAEELAAGIPHARLVLFEHSGHYPFLEEPEAFWKAVRGFLQEVMAASDEHRSAGS